MIESVTWTNIMNGQSVTLNADDTPLHVYSTDVAWRQDDIENPQEHGDIPGNPYLGSRLIHLEGTLLKNTSFDYMTLRHNLTKSMVPSGRYGNKVVGTLRILFTGMTESVQMECSLDGWPELPMENLAPSVGDFQINFKAYDPRMYSVSTYTVTQQIAGAAVSGRTYPETYPKTYSAGSAPYGDMVITNSGDIETYPVVAITGPTTSPTLSLLSPTPTRTLEFGELVISAGETVTIDFLNRTAISSLGRDVYFSLTRREWWALESGNNTVRFGAYSASSPAAATYTWRNAYMI